MDLTKMSHEIRTNRIQLTDTTNPLLMMRFRDPEPDSYAADDLVHTITIANGAGAGTTLRLTCTDDDGANNIDGATYTTLKTFVDAINALGIGFEAIYKDGARDYPMNTNDFIDLAAVALGPEWTNVLYTDASEVKTSSTRLVVPNHWEPNKGKIIIESIQAFADSDSATDCELKVSRDPGPLATDEVEIASAYIPDAAQTLMWSPNMSSPVIGIPHAPLRGPVLVEVTATTSLATTLDVQVNWRIAEL